MRPIIRRPIDLGEILVRTAVVLLVVAVLVALVATIRDGDQDERRSGSEIASLRRDLEAARADLARADDVAACRSGLANGVSDATSSYLLTIGGFVEALATEDRDQTAKALGVMVAAGDALDTARDLRNEFEKAPAPCDPPPATAGAVASGP